MSTIPPPVAGLPHPAAKPKSREKSKGAKQTKPKPVNRDELPISTAEDNERHLLAKLLVKPELLDEFTLAIDAFENPSHRILYDTLLGVRHNGNGGQGNIPTRLTRALGERLNDIGGMPFIAKILAIESYADYTYYLEQVTAAYQKRQATAELHRIQDALAAGCDPAELLAETTTRIAAMQSFPTGTRVYAGDRGNIGEVTADNGDTCTVHFVSPDGSEADKEIDKAELKILAIGSGAVNEALEPIPIATLRTRFPELRPPRIHGLLRAGEVGSIIAAPKVGKSWLSAELALAAGLGFQWVGFDIDPGAVLLIDNELHPEVISHRLAWLADNRGRNISDATIDVLSLRGRGKDLLALRPTIDAVGKKYSYIVLDAWYRLLPPGMDENSNSDMTALFNVLDEYAAITGATCLAVHHTSKGIQGGKAVTDVGSGAGAQSRAVDAHLVIREHEEEGAFVVHAACRSFKPMEPFCLRRNFPLWERDDSLDPALMKRERPSRGRGDSGKAAEPIEQWDAERFVGEFFTDTPQDKAAITGRAHERGLSYRQIRSLFDQVEYSNLAHFEPSSGRRKALYAKKSAFIDFEQNATSGVSCE